MPHSKKLGNFRQHVLPSSAASLQFSVVLCGVIILTTHAQRGGVERGREHEGGVERGREHKTDVMYLQGDEVREPTISG